MAQEKYFKIKDNSKVTHREHLGIKYYTIRYLHLVLSHLSYILTQSVALEMSAIHL